MNPLDSERCPDGAFGGGVDHGIDEGHAADAVIDLRIVGNLSVWSFASFHREDVVGEVLDAIQARPFRHRDGC